MSEIIYVILKCENYILKFDDLKSISPNGTISIVGSYAYRKLETGINEIINELSEKEEKLYIQDSKNDLLHKGRVIIGRDLYQVKQLKLK